MRTSGDPVKVLYVGGRPEPIDVSGDADDEDGLRVTISEDEETGLGLLSSRPFDCVVGDVADGIELLDAVRDRWPEVPYVFVADEGSDIATEVLAGGATDYLERRADRDQRALLAARVRNAVGRRTADRLVGTIDGEDAEDGERARIAAALRENEIYLRKLYRTASSAELSFEEKRHRLLELGRERLGVDIGFVSRIDGDSFEIVDAVGSHELIQAGKTAPLADTYCRKTMDDEGLLSVQDAESAGWLDEPAYQRYELGCYVGGKVFVNGDLYGTLCFADREPRDRSFTDSEKAYVELITQWFRYEREQLADERALREQNERLEEFASVVSHDLRNPLNVAEIYLHMAEESGAEEDFEQVRCAHDRMERLIQSLLMLARQGSALGEITEHDLSAVAEDAWANVETDDSSYRTDGDATVRAEGERLQQLLENLFRNAVEHGSDGRVCVRVGSLGGVSGSESNGDSTDESVGEDGFYVEDDGAGIPEDEREKVLEHGFSTSDGTGLGLAIVQRIAEAHGWAVSVCESDSGGARFEVRNATD